MAEIEFNVIYNSWYTKSVLLFHQIKTDSDRISYPAETEPQILKGESEKGLSVYK